MGPGPTQAFCRTFNFELQAAASEDAIVLSLSTSHSFELDEVWRYLHSNSAHTLIQAVLDAPLFGVRWRWNAGVALALPRYTGGRKVAPQIQRMKSEDLIASVFPIRLPAWKTWSANGKSPTIRWWNKPSMIACTTPWTVKAGWRCCGAWSAVRSA